MPFSGCTPFPWGISLGRSQGDWNWRAPITFFPSSADWRRRGSRAPELFLFGCFKSDLMRAARAADLAALIDWQARQRYQQPAPGSGAATWRAGGRFGKRMHRQQQHFEKIGFQAILSVPPGARLNPVNQWLPNAGTPAPKYPHICLQPTAACMHLRWSCLLQMSRHSRGNLIQLTDRLIFGSYVHCREWQHCIVACSSSAPTRPTNLPFLLQTDATEASDDDPALRYTTHKLTWHKTRGFCIKLESR